MYDAILCIGPGRSGSTFVHNALVEWSSGEIFLKEREILYGNLFKLSFPLLDVSNTQIYRINLSDRIKKFSKIYPDKKILILLLIRSTRDRIVSLYKYQKSVGIIQNIKKFEENLIHNQELYFFNKQLLNLLKLRQINVDIKYLKFGEWDKLENLRYSLGVYSKLNRNIDKNISLQPKLIILMPLFRKIYKLIDYFFGKEFSYKIKKNMILKKIFFNKSTEEVFFSKKIELLLQDKEMELNKIIKYEAKSL